MSSDPDGQTIPLLLAASGASRADSPFAAVLLLIVLILINAFFSASEIAVITMNDAKIEKMAEDGNRRAQKLQKLTVNSSRFFSTIQIGVTLAGFLTSASASESFSDDLAALLSFLPFSPSFIKGASTLLITLLLSYFSLVFGELVPKQVAMKRAEELSFHFAGVLSAVASVFRPVVSLLTASTNVVLRFLGVDPDSGGQTVTEEEILMMVDAGEEKGVLNENEKDMISNIFEFSDLTVDEAMTHRTDVIAAEDTDSVGDAVTLAMDNGYSRIPVFHEDLDSITGIIYVKDLLKYVGKQVEPGIRLTDVMRPAYFVPESKLCGELFSDMTAHHVQIAVVVDEYGGTEGIITMEDLLEAIVGSIQDEYDNEAEEIHRDGENRFDVEGTAPVDEVSEMLGVDLPEGDYDTVAGLMMERLGRLPRENEHPQVKLDGLTLTVAAMEERRIARILIEKDAPVPKTQPEPGKSGN
ncbi:HlyC/CorC family transporter [Caproiciproducens sp. NJN-50]|uniref:hemolysin family protein n=1 Tax=Acutalibacteraceae TaxID=3082771 RepID=UPI000FFE19C3|nr:MULTISPECIES: hemolysin family protein [Acutalibacteraceae]QAT51069.1 HlyC/CorC family transporter [Caproiciproducens sp. NJN-50]